jgi:hypothetical protein
MAVGFLRVGHHTQNQTLPTDVTVDYRVMMSKNLNPLIKPADLELMEVKLPLLCAEYALAKGKLLSSLLCRQTNFVCH